MTQSVTASSDRARAVARLQAGLMVVNALYGVLSVILMCVGIYFSVDKASFVTLVIGSSLPYVSTVLVTLAGAISIVISVVGCCGTITRNRCLLIVYTVIVIAAYMLALSGVSSAIVFRSWISDQIRNYMRNVLQTQYGVNDSQSAVVTSNWDIVQQKWYCCGVEDQSWGVYRESEWFSLQPGLIEADKPLVPMSCCKIDQYGRFYNTAKCQTFLLGPPSLQSGELNEALYYQGCYETGTTILLDVAAYVIGMGIFLCCFDVGLVCLSMWAVRKLGE